MTGLYLWQVRFGLVTERIVNVLAVSVSDAIEKACRSEKDCLVDGITQVKRQELYVYYDSVEPS